MNSVLCGLVSCGSCCVVLAALERQRLGSSPLQVASRAVEKPPGQRRSQAQATFASVSRLAPDPIPLSVQFRTQSEAQFAVLGRLGHGNHRLREGDIG